MPTAIRNFFSFIFSLLFSHKETEEERKRAQARNERKQELKEEKAKRYKIMETWLDKKDKMTEQEAEDPDQVRLERQWAKKAVKINYSLITLYGISNMPRFYKAKIVPIGTFAKNELYVYLYVVAPTSSGTTVFVYAPHQEKKSQYAAYSFYDEVNYIPVETPKHKKNEPFIYAQTSVEHTNAWTALTDPATLELAARLFDCLSH